MIGAIIGRLVTRTARNDSRRDHCPLDLAVPRALRWVSLWIGLLGWEERWGK